MKSLSTLIDRLIAAPAERKSGVEHHIRHLFEKFKTVLALDMSGFTLVVRREGILPYLCEIRRMQLMTLPILQSHQGELVKYDADSLIAVFDDPSSAVKAAISIQKAALEPQPKSQFLALSIGIDCGEVLLVPGVDCFGDAVNLAHKLGEDLAQAGEILLSFAVSERLPAASQSCLQRLQLSVSGMDLLAYKVMY